MGTWSLKVLPICSNKWCIVLPIPIIIKWLSQVRITMFFKLAFKFSQFYQWILLLFLMIRIFYFTKFFLSLPYRTWRYVLHVFLAVNIRCHIFFDIKTDLEPVSTNIWTKFVALGTRTGMTEQCTVCCQLVAWKMFWSNITIGKGRGNSYQKMKRSPDERHS